MKTWFTLLAGWWMCALTSLGASPRDYPFPKHPPINERTFPPYILEDMAKVGLGKTRGEIVQSVRPKDGTMLCEFETYHVHADVSLNGQQWMVFYDIIFQPALMDDKAFAEALPREVELRSQGRWPMPDVKDVARAVSAPYLGPRLIGAEAVEVSKHSSAIRNTLQRLKTGLTRREIQRDFAPSTGSMEPPAEPYIMRGTHVYNRYDAVTLAIGFKPKAMDEVTCGDPRRRAAWFASHTYFPGDDLDDTVMDFYWPENGRPNSPDETIIDTHKLAAADRERLQALRVGLTRKNVDKNFWMGGGLNSSWSGGIYCLRDPATARFSRDPKDLITVRLSFTPDGTTEQRFNAEMMRTREAPQEKDSDVLTNFSKPFASSQGRAID